MLDVTRKVLIGCLMTFGLGSFVDINYELVARLTSYGFVYVYPRQKPPDYGAICARNPQFTPAQCRDIVDQYYAASGY